MAKAMKTTNDIFLLVLVFPENFSYFYVVIIALRIVLINWFSFLVRLLVWKMSMNFNEVK